MNTQLTHVDAKLNAYQVAVALSDNPTELVSEIYKEIFRGGFYREIWDERILLALGELTAQHPPNEEVYGEELKFLEDRTLQVVEINTLFAALLFCPSVGLPEPGVHVPDRSKVTDTLALLAANGNLEKIRQSSSQPKEKIAAFVEELSKAVPSNSELLRRCLESVGARQELGAVSALLVTQPARVGIVLLVKAMLQAGSGVIRPMVPIHTTFSSAVDRACGALRSRGFLSTTQDVMFSADLTDAIYSGSSIALGAAMAMFSSGRGWQFDPYTAFTGDINIKDHQWRVLRVEGIPEKLQAARRRGIRRVVLPFENEPDIPAVCRNVLDIVLVDDINEVLSKLTLPQSASLEDTTQQKKISLLNSFSAVRVWQASAAKAMQNGLQFAVTPATGSALTLSIYDTGTHAPKQHQKPQFQELLDQLSRFDDPDTPLQSVQETFNIKIVDLRQQIKGKFQSLVPSDSKTESYCDYSFVFENGKEKLIVKQFSSGKLQLQGRAGPLYRRALEIIIPLYNLHFPNAELNITDYLAKATVDARLPAEPTAPQAQVGLPHIGTDESGKGDYFGPLVIAAVWIDESLEVSLKRLGVRDSKEISDSQCQKLAAAVREICDGRYQVIEISPEKYNQLQAQMVREKKNLNHLLAWGHARAIESLLSRHHCDQAIADQFGDEKYIASKLMAKGRSLRLLQTPKAERFIAVAAASVLARDHFLTRLSELGKEAGVALPKGASQAAIVAARQIVKARGTDALSRFVKFHFKTTASVLARQ
jgi:ribonuclease HIII